MLEEAMGAPTPDGAIIAKGEQISARFLNQLKY